MTGLWLDYQQQRPLHWLGPLLLALAAAATALSGAYWLDLNDRASALEQKLEMIEHGHGIRIAGGQRSQQTLAQEVARANEVLHQLTLPWQELLLAVEAAGGRNVTLLSLEPDMERREVKISGEARDMMLLLNYISQLEQQEAFGQVLLQNHQVQLRDPERPVRFALLAVWKEKP
jgi:hypothetical protein